MKDEFPGYFRPTEKTVEDIWRKALFTFDANVLLNLYRYSNETRDEVFKVLQLVEKDSWFPNQSILEYLENRLQVISDQSRAYTLIDEELKKIEAKFDHPRQHPFLSERRLERLKKAHEDVSGELKKRRDQHLDRLDIDEIREKLADLTQGKIGPGFSSEALKAIQNEAKTRYAQKIPPGYKDDNKDDGNGERKYGDYLLWLQLMKKAKETQRDIIFVTDDQKEDWWQLFKGKTMGPRPELVKEFGAQSGQTILFYKPDQFLKLVGRYLKSEVGDDTIKEVRELTVPSKSDTVVLKSYDDYRYLDTKKILFLKSDNNTTDFFLGDGNVVSAFRTLKSFENTLPNDFIRVHQDYIINNRFVDRINYGKRIIGLDSSQTGPTEIPFSNFYKENVDRLRNDLEGN